jgi:hypothetical protein
MTKLWRALVVVATGALILGVSVAFAGVPHLKSASGIITDSTTARTAAAATLTASGAKGGGFVANPNPLLTVRFTATGVDTADSFSLSAVASATYVCVNNGNQIPDAANKVTIDLPVSAGAAAANPDKNGRFSGQVTTSPLPFPPSGFSCPSGQSVALASITFTGIQLEAIDNGVTIVDTVPIDPLSKTYISL